MELLFRRKSDDPLFQVESLVHVLALAEIEDDLAAQIGTFFNITVLTIEFCQTVAPFLIKLIVNEGLECLDPVLQRSLFKRKYTIMKQIAHIVVRHVLAVHLIMCLCLPGIARFDVQVRDAVQIPGCRRNLRIRQQHKIDSPVISPDLLVSHGNFGEHVRVTDFLPLNRVGNLHHRIIVFLPDLLADLV